MELDTQNVVLESEIETDAIQGDMPATSGDALNISDTENENDDPVLPELSAEELLINMRTDEEMETESDSYQYYISHEHSDSIINATLPPLFGLGFAVVTLLSLVSYALFKALGLININKEN